MNNYNENRNAYPFVRTQIQNHYKLLFLTVLFIWIDLQANVFVSHFFFLFMFYYTLIYCLNRCYQLNGSIFIEYIYIYMSWKCFVLFSFNLSLYRVSKRVLFIYSSVELCGHMSYRLFETIRMSEKKSVNSAD